MIFPARTMAEAVSNKEFPLQELVLAGGGLIVVVLAGVAVLTWIRRRYRDARQVHWQEPFTLEQLRQLHRQGQLSDDEFNRAKAHLIEQLRGVPGRTDPPPPTAPGSTSS